jgi:hypothetical protein
LKRITRKHQKVKKRKKKRMKMMMMRNNHLSSTSHHLSRGPSYLKSLVSIVSSTMVL